jgi:FtsP/CotA-like multicopper oxidase with cupredoxin domain
MTQPPLVPEAIRVPEGRKLVLIAHASGVQIYARSDAHGQAAWQLKAPEATLFDEQGRAIGIHFAGPTWRLHNGSEVVATVVARAPSPDAGAIPWLLLTVTHHSGNDVFSRVTDVQRIHTAGGQPPAGEAARDLDKQPPEYRSSYEADYYFYAASK